jgi:hypothetical protein
MPEETILDEGQETTVDSDLGEQVESPEEAVENQSEVAQPQVDWSGKYNEVLTHNRALNKKLIELQRQANANTEKPSQANEVGGRLGDNNFVTKMKLAESDLRTSLEDIISLYPELDPSTVARIRQNPWAFTRRDTFESLNVKNALLDIEQNMANLVSALEQKPDVVEGPKPTQKQVKPSQVDTASLDEEEEAENDWTMPLDQLERKKDKILRANRTR